MLTNLLLSRLLFVISAIGKKVVAQLDELLASQRELLRRQGNGADRQEEQGQSVVS
jgi:hypothetical protein